MHLHVGFLVRPTTWRHKLPGSDPISWLSRIGLTGHDLGSVTLDQDAFEAPDTITIITQKNRELWLGLGVFEIFNALCKITDFSPLGTGVVFVADDNSGYYGLQEFYGGTPGWGGQVMRQPAQIWNRDLNGVAKTADQNRKTAFAGIANLLGADPELIERCIRGQNSKGRYGIAWHSEKNEWVMAMLGAEGPGQFHELDPASYARIGIPFDGEDHPDGWPCFWRQNNLFSAVQDHLSRAWTDISLSEIAPNLDALDGPCQGIALTP